MVLAGLSIMCMSGCTKETKKTGTKQIVTTIFPIYDWTTEILGENPDGIDVKMLLDKGVDLHSYQPSVDDIMLISNCDVFIYVGGESDAWVSDALAQATNKDMVVINLMELMGSNAKEEETVEGMQEHDHEHEEDHDEDHDEHHDEDHDKDHDEDHDEEKEYDEHVWLSLKNAMLFCRNICDKICSLDSANADLYRSNTDAYCRQLEALNGEYQKAADASVSKTLLFADRFPFRYLTDDYGLRYYAAFSGCSSETEASFDTIIFLSDKLDELKLNVILQTESADGSVAETVKSNTRNKNQKILTLDSLQSVTSENIKNGATYLSVMKDNLKVLQQAFNSEQSPM